MFHGLKVGFMFRLLVAILCCFSIVSFAQESNRQYYSVDESRQGQKPIRFLVFDPAATENETSLSAKSADTEELRIIVRLKAAPVASVSPGRTNDALRTIDQEHTQFISQLSSLQIRHNTARVAVAPAISFEYKQTFNGFALSASREVVEQIRKLPNVTMVAVDKRVDAYDMESNELINVPKVWSHVGATGKGITVGIIDTGVDYNHPALGGGFGPAFKVAGGYDFVNNDSDPLDDNGHGTHVAGIAAANGTDLKGVAPEATIYAYKVLNQYGYGNDSQILAAVERVTDPDGNANTDDALDVVNMSLGRVPDADDPLSEAVNNAVKKGVVFVIAAGNSYDYLSIGTPGIAEQAITVGAVDKQKITANFSSKGPVEKTFLLKPDVAAPGVNIFSSFTGKKYKMESGTSMASPHVAGVVALLLEKHPEWEPETIKAVLMTTARSYFGLVWEQGAGLIDAFAAIQSPVLLSPGSVSFGAVDNTVTNEEKNAVLTVTNTGNHVRSFSLKVDGSIKNAATSFWLSETSFTLQPGEKKQVKVTLNIKTSLLPVMHLPEAYTGAIVLQSDGHTLKTTLTLVNPRITKLKFTGELPINFTVIGLEGNNYWRTFLPTQDIQELYLPDGKYDIITRYRDMRTVVTEEISTIANTTIDLDKAQAKNMIVFKPLDKNGQPIPLNPSSLGRVSFTGKDKNFYTLYLGLEDTLYVSDLKAYWYDFKVFSPGVDRSENYEITAGTGYGLNQSKVVSNDLSFLDFNLHNPSAAEGGDQNMIFYFKSGNLTSWNGSPMRIPNPLHIFCSSNNSSYFDGSYVNLSPADSNPGYSWESGLWKIDKDNKLSFSDVTKKNPVTINRSDFKHRFGNSLLRFNAYTANNSNAILLSDYPSTGTFNRFLGERENGSVSYKLTKVNESEVASGIFPNRMMNEYSPARIIDLPAQAAAYRLLLTYEDYQAGGRFGKAEVTLDFDLRNHDKNPPFLEYLSLEVDGVSTCEIREGEPARIKIKLTDYCYDYFTWIPCTSSGIAEVKLTIKKDGSDRWQELALTQSQGFFTGALPSALDQGYYSLLLQAKDYQNNTLTYSLNPGFMVGDSGNKTPYATVTLQEPVNHSINAGTRPQFRWSDLPDASYRFQVSRTADFTNLVEDATTADNKYMLPFDLPKDSTYYWRVKAVYSQSSIPWSKASDFQSKILPAAVLLSPENFKEDVPYQQPRFKWEKAAGANSYIFELSEFEDLSYPFLFTWLPDTASTFMSPHLMPGKTYYWRVTAYFYTYYRNYGIPSEIFRFTTQPLPVGMAEDISYTRPYNYPNPFSESTAIVLHAKQPEEIVLTIVDALGQKVKESSHQLVSGVNIIPWDAKNQATLSPGTYIGHITRRGMRQQVKMILVDQLIR